MEQQKVVVFLRERKQGAGHPPGGYDANGNVLADSAHVYTWDSDGKPASIDGTAVGMTFDALGRNVEQNRAGVYFQMLYAPNGRKLAVMKGQVIQQAFVPLPGGGTAEYLSWGLSHFRHSDWLGSTRLGIGTAHNTLQSNAYAPFGEPYAMLSGGNGEVSFTGQNKDTLWLQYDFLFRQYEPKQGRWVSPDPAGREAVDPSNPQTWNRYQYVGGNPLGVTDALGLSAPRKRPGRPPKSPVAGGQTCIPAAFQSMGGCSTSGGNDIFDALEGNPGTYLYLDRFGNLSWGFSPELWAASLDFRDAANRGMVNAPAKADYFGVFVRDVGSDVTVEGLVPELIDLQARQARLFGSLPPQLQGLLAGSPPELWGAMWDWGLRQYPGLSSQVPYWEQLGKDWASWVDEAISQSTMK